MGAPTVYYYDDPGAPVIGNAGNERDGLYQLLRACLVDGYGSKPPAGWSVVYDDWAAAGHASFTNASGSGVLGLVRAAAVGYPPFMYVAEAMIDSQTAVNARSGRVPVSDVTAFSEGSTQYTQRPWFRSAGKASYWCVIANEHAAFVFTNTTMNKLFSINPYSGQSENDSFLFIGAARSLVGLGGISDAEAGNFHIVGGHWSSMYSESYGSFKEWSDVSSTNIRGGTIFYDHTGALATGNQYQYVTPFVVSSLITSNGFGNSASEPLLPLEPAIIFGTSGNSFQTARQLAVLPMLKGWAALSRHGGGWGVVSALGVLSLRTPFMVGDKPHFTAPLRGGHPGFISLAAVDWS